jgi:hypothetical protein
MNSQKLPNTGVMFDAKTYTGEMQDKATPSRSYSASGEPSYISPPAQLQSNYKHHGSNRRKGGQASGYYTHEELRVFERLRGTGKKKLTRSVIVTRLTRIGLAVSMDNEQFTMLEPRIVTTIERMLRQYTNRTDSLLAKIFYSMEFFRLLFIRFFKLYVGDNKMVDELVTDLEKEARDNIK